ncbi:MAG: branched-chain amino acid ABC transporter permease [Bifidobacteriaceae bacterium]|nr:branched-chain amino acid ABC transporter permease [Bifidobacteriaceae bacterium]
MPKTSQTRQTRQTRQTSQTGQAAGQRAWRLPAPPPKYVRIHVGSKGLFGPRRFMDALGLALFALAFFLPFITADAYVISIATSAAIFVLLASGLNVVVGYAGLLDLGYVAFFAVGAYTSGIMSTRYGWGMLPTIPVVLVACVIAGVVIGGPTLRLRSDYLAIVTLGFGEIIRRVAQNLELTGGATGIYGIKKFSFFGIDLSKDITAFGLTFPPNISFYMFTVACMGIGVVFAARLAKGRMGRAWQAVRDDEDAAEAMGINTYTTKLTAYITGAVWGGMAGMLQGAHVGGISPTQFMFLNSALILMAVVMGGMGSTPGIILGALFISLLPEFLRSVANARYLVFGVALVAVMVFRPKGLWPASWHLPFLGSGHVVRTGELVAQAAVQARQDAGTAADRPVPHYPAGPLDPHVIENAQESDAASSPTDDDAGTGGAASDNAAGTADEDGSGR